MRVTQSMLTGNMLRNLSNSYERLAIYQEQIYTGKKITRPSQDPVVAMKGMHYRTNLGEVEQFKRNYAEATNWLDNADEALDKLGKALHNIRELVTQAANDPLSDEQRGYIGKEIEEIRNHIVEIANTKVGNKYIFNGTDTLEKPVDLSVDPPVYPTNPYKPVTIELAKGVYIDVSVDTSDIFGDQDGKLFSDLDKLVSMLNEGTTGEELTSFIQKIEDHTDSVLSTRASLGAQTNRIELMQERIEHQAVIAERMMADNEGVDAEKAITDLIMEESLLRAALGVGARVMQPSLLDFLR